MEAFSFISLNGNWEHCGVSEKPFHTTLKIRGTQ